MIGRRLSPGDLLLLHGPLGAGKTVITKGIAHALDIAATVTSPTYMIVKEYEGRLTLYHIDLYRLDGPDEFELLGLEEILEGDGVAIVEWPERAHGAFPDTAKVVNVRINKDLTRSIGVPTTLLEGR